MKYKYAFFSVLILRLFCCTEAPAQNTPWGLDECIRYGIEKSLALQQERLRNENQELQTRDHILGMLPTVNSISPSVSYSFGRSIDPETNTYTSTRYTSVGGFGIGSSITLFAGFSQINRIRLARLAEASGMQQLENQANQLALQIMTAFFSVVYAEEQVRITEEQFENSRLRRLKIETEYELGTRAKSDLYDIQAQQASDEYQLISVRNSYQNALSYLKHLMNYEEAGEFSVVFSPEEVPVDMTLPAAEEVFRQAQEWLPHMQVSRNSLREAKLSLAISRASLLPSVYLSGSYSFSSYTNQRSGSVWEQVTDKNRIGKGFSVGLNIPLYGGLSRQSNLRRAKNSLKISEMQHTQAGKNLHREVLMAVQDLASCIEQYKVALEREKFSELSFDAAKKRYDLKLSSMIDLNTTSNNLLQARYNLLRARLDYVMQKKMIDYYRGIPLQHQITSQK